jgi:exosome complex component RRP4
MSELLVKEKEIAVPGEVLATGMDYLPTGSAFREGENIVACQLGLISINNHLVKVIPLTGKYVPKAGDTVIGKVVDMTFSNWFIEIGCANEAVLSLKDTSEFIERGADLTQYYDYDDVVIAKVVKVTRAKSIDLTMKGPGLRKIKGGKILEVTPSKVPRVIGKQGSMISMIKEITGCNVVVGQNGKVWIQGEDLDKETLATQAIIMIEQGSHLEGLTDKVKSFLESKGTKQ